MNNKRSLIVLITIILIIFSIIIYLVYNNRYSDDYIKETYAILKDYKSQKINNTTATKELKALHQKATEVSLNKPQLTKTCLKMGIIEQYLNNEITEKDMNKNIKEIDKIYK